jgi:hypothetical protein
MPHLDRFEVIERLPVGVLIAQSKPEEQTMWWSFGHPHVLLTLSACSVYT